MSVLTRAEVKAHLVISANAHDAQIDVFTARGEAAVVSRVGPLIPTTKTESHDGGAVLIKSLFRPIQSIGALAESYGTYYRTLAEQPLDGSGGFSAYGYTVDKEDGVIYRRISGVAGPFAAGRRNVTLTYTYGWSTDSTSATLPGDLTLAILEVIRALWEDSQRGGNVAPGRDAEPDSTPGALDTFPPDVERLLQPFEDHGIY